MEVFFFMSVVKKRKYDVQFRVQKRVSLGWLVEGDPEFCMRVVESVGVEQYDSLEDL